MFQTRIHPPPSVEDLYVWVDVCSIPQRNAGIKGLSILSLPAYAGASDYFVAVVPDARNIDSGNACTRDTYLRRAWCRAEQPKAALPENNTRS